MIDAEGPFLHISLDGAAALMQHYKLLAFLSTTKPTMHTSVDLQTPTSVQVRVTRLPASGR